MAPSLTTGTLFPGEDPRLLPLMFAFGEEAEGAVNRWPGLETEYFTQQYQCPDTD